MAREHRLPPAEPESDLVVALFIPHDSIIVGLVLGALSALENEEYFALDDDGGNAGAIAAADMFRRRVIMPLVDYIAEQE